MNSRTEEIPQISTVVRCVRNIAYEPYSDPYASRSSSLRTVRTMSGAFFRKPGRPYASNALLAGEICGPDGHPISRPLTGEREYPSEISDAELTEALTRLQEAVGRNTEGVVMIDEKAQVGELRNTPRRDLTDD
jgi:hypothetical protein